MSTHQVKLAKATEDDFKIMWKVFDAFQEIENSGQISELREERLNKVTIGRLLQLGTGGFTRIVMGCETLIDNVCDKNQDYYELTPSLLNAETELDKAHAALEAILKTGELSSDSVAIARTTLGLDKYGLNDE
ncbi:hypothetical protein PVK62_07740 [Aliivibrio sp. S3MY1]|uniref:Uncharacterized protein n=1 Tax=Aliivibrio wodanis TaxID=80852 RepID=A0A5Q4ZYE7_9GAMM|nr:MULTISPECIES: hypothetical protein [Aliivibrio]MDD9195730.1 hypothetical protein [Aliivibrio sp. S3MY1]VVV06883.1 hypothetical protein AW0309160_04377 [Aliivibrio wodanis]